MATASAPGANARTYAQPPLVRALARTGVVLSAGSILFLLALPFLDHGTTSLVLIFCCLVTVLACLVVAIAIVRRSGDLIVVADDGLRCESPNAPPVFIPWNEVGSVVPQNVMQRIVVTDTSGTRRIHLEFHLQRFGELRRAVLERAVRRS
jgi:hypothetical protein